MIGRECHDSGRIMPKPLSQRATDALHDLWTRRVIQQNDLAAKTGRPGSVINRIIHGRQPVTLDILEAVGELSGLDPMELLAGVGSEIKALNPLEAELLRYARTWPKPIQMALLTFLRHFAGESALESQARIAISYLRAMGATERHRAMAYLLLLSEGQLPDDIRAKLEADPAPTLPGGSIDALLVGIPAADVALVRDVAKKARLANQKKRKHGAG